MGLNMGLHMGLHMVYTWFSSGFLWFFGGFLKPIPRRFRVRIALVAPACRGRLEGGAQGGKTTSLQVAACWALDNHLAPTMVVTQTDEAAKRFSRQRLLPMIESCESLAAQLPDDRHERTTRAFDPLAFLR